MFAWFKNKSKTPSKTINNASTQKNINWQNEEYDLVILQRNVLLILLILFILLSIASVFVLVHINNNIKIKPYVIQIDKETGKATVIKESKDIISQNDSLAQFFIKKYIIARETYNPVDFSTQAINTVKLFSDPQVFSQFLGYIRNAEINPTIKYGNFNSTYLIVKSWSKISNNAFMVRFSVNETTGALNKFNKIAVIHFEYLEKELSQKELDINPVGFTVTSYRVDSDES